MASGEDSQQTSTGAAPVAAADLGRTLVNNLNTAATKAPTMSDGTIRSLQAIDNGAGQYQGGLNDAFNATSNLATTGGLNNIPGLDKTLAALQGISTNGISVSNGAADFNDVLGKYKSLYAQSNVPTESATWLTPQLAALSQPSYADTQARQLYEQSQQPSYAQTGYKGIVDSLAGPSITEQNLTGYANGSLIGANPYLDAAIAAARGNTSGAVNATFANSGRLGSGLNISTLGKTLDDSETGARLQQYNQDVQNQFGANAAIEAARAGVIGQKEGALSGYDTATNNQLARGLSALSAEDQFRLSQLGALRDTTGQIDTSNDNRTNTLSGVLAGQTNAVGAKTSAAQSAASISANAQLGAANSLLGASQNATANQLAAANSLGGQFQNALAPSLASLAVGQAVDANNNAPVNNSLAILQGLGGGAAQGVAAEVPWWQQILGTGVGLAGSALSGGALK